MKKSKYLLKNIFNHFISIKKLIKKYYHKIIIFIIIILYLFIPKTNSLIKIIKVGLVANSIKNGGAERSVSLICYYFKNI